MNGPHRIDTADDPRVDVYRDVRDRDLRGREGLFMAESEMVVRRLLRTPERLQSIFLSPPRLEAMRDVLHDMPDAVAVYTAPLDVMTAIAGFHIHRGVLAAGLRPAASSLVPEQLMDALPAEGPCLVVAAQGMTNVDNMGGLFRLAAAFGAHGVLLDSTCCDPLYRKAIRVSMGHTLSTPMAVTADLADTLQALRSRGLGVWAAESAPQSVPLNSAPPPARAVIVLGNEGHGLSDDVMRVAETVVEIPMADGVPSLNVTSAASVVLWERARALAVT
ncbi:MAG: RNA methyltransferase [Phycisphaerales bacterium]|nr:RNA methyltransferase [Phycisphaerales bacterium]